MGRRRDVYRAIAAQQQLREQYESQRLPAPEATIPDDLELYGEVVTASEFEASKKAAEERFIREVEAAEQRLKAEADVVKAKLDAEAQELAKKQTTLEEAEAKWRAEQKEAEGRKQQADAIELQTKLQEKTLEAQKDIAKTEAEQKQKKDLLSSPPVLLGIGLAAAKALGFI